MGQAERSNQRRQMDNTDCRTKMRVMGGELENFKKKGVVTSEIKLEKT